MTDKKTRLLLDVDGCLNFFGGRTALDKDNFELPWPTREEAVVRGYTIVWSPDMLAALDALDLEIVWLTTWRESAVNDLAPVLGWGADFRVLHPLPEDEWMYQTVASIKWKLPALLADQEADPSPFIWVDDEVGMKEAVEATRIGGRAIAPNPYLGITESNIATMVDYIKNK